MADPTRCSRYSTSTPARLYALSHGRGWDPRRFWRRSIRSFCGTANQPTSDPTNGPEFIATALQTWLKKVGIKPIQIYPGSPWENGYNERFNGTLRREVLNAEWFSSIRQAQTVIDKWMQQYNHVRPHQALNMRPPVPETLSETGP